MLAQERMAASENNPAAWARRTAPNAITAVRAALGMYLMFLVSQGQTGTAAVVWLFGLGTDVLDGALARRLRVHSEFGTLFDYFADYVYYVLAPGLMSLFLLEERTGSLRLLLLSLPAPFAAMRYARKAGLRDDAYPGIPASPGLPAVVYGFFVISLVFLREEQALEGAQVDWALLAGAPVLSMLMLARIRYPKLGVYSWILMPVLAGLIVMPFFHTAMLSRVQMAIVISYTVLSPALIEQHPERKPGPCH